MPGITVQHKDGCPWVSDKLQECTCYTSQPAQKIPSSILQEAEQLINGQRRDDYGDVNKSFEQIAQLWSPILGKSISPRQVGLCMIQLKISRYLHGQTRDSLVDIAGYAGCLEKLDG